MLSLRRSLEQQRAGQAWTCVIEAKKKPYAAEYRALAVSAPIEVQLHGLGQTFAFWRAKGFSDSQPSNDEHTKLFEDVSQWLRHRMPQIRPPNVLEWICTEATTYDYSRATAEAIAFLTWLRRFAEAELPRKVGGN